MNHIFVRKQYDLVFWCTDEGVARPSVLTRSFERANCTTVAAGILVSGAHEWEEEVVMEPNDTNIMNKVRFNDFVDTGGIYGKSMYLFCTQYLSIAKYNVFK